MINWIKSAAYAAYRMTVGEWLEFTSELDSLSSAYGVEPWEVPAAIIEDVESHNIQIPTDAVKH